MLRRLGRSLSFRLLAIFLVMGVLFAYGAVLGIRWVYVTDDLRELVSGHLRLHVEYVRSDIGSPPRIENAIAITDTVPVDIRISGPNIDWASDPAFPRLSELSFGSSDVFSDVADGWLRDLDDVEFATRGSHGFLKINQGVYSIVVSTPKIADSAENRSLTPIIMGFGLFLVLLAYLAVRWLFKPIGAIREGAAQIGSGNFNHRISDVRRDQLGDLADDINRMAGDVERMLDAKRQLLYGISHELRSPLSRMKLELELDDENHPELNKDIQEMEKIIATLLEAERLNSRHAAISVSRVQATTLVDELIADFFSAHRDRLHVSVAEDLYLNVDENRITLMLKNLVSNALRYSSDGADPVDIDIDTENDAWVLRVRDRGPGFPAEHIDHLGEPFFRGDRSRTRTTGGSGLGLYIAKLVAEAHGGSLDVDPDYRDGACMVVTLPFEPSV